MPRRSVGEWPRQWLVSLGKGNWVSATRLLLVLEPGTAPARRLRQQAAQEGKLVDLTRGKTARALVVLDSGHVVAMANTGQTLAQRMLAATSGDASASGE